MRIVLFSRVPRWYSFKNERLASRLTADGHEIVGAVVEQNSTVKALRDWTKKLGRDVFLKKLGQKALSKTVGNSAEIENENNAPRVEVAPDVFLVKSHNSPECVEILHDLEPDLIVLHDCEEYRQRAPMEFLWNQFESKAIDMFRSRIEGGSKPFEASKKCSANSMAKRFIAAFQFLIGIVHLFDAACVAGKTTFSAASSVGNTFRFFVAFRITEFIDSMVFVV